MSQMSILETSTTKERIKMNSLKKSYGLEWNTVPHESIL